MRMPAAVVFGLCAFAPALAAANADPPGKAAYDRNCAACHGPEGRGEAGPRLIPLDRDFAEVLAIVREGIGEMPPVGPSALTDEGVRLVVDYLKSIRGDSVPASSRQFPGVPRRAPRRGR